MKLGYSDQGFSINVSLSLSMSHQNDFTPIWFKRKEGGKELLEAETGRKESFFCFGSFIYYSRVVWTVWFWGKFGVALGTTGNSQLLLNYVRPKYVISWENLS